MTSPLGWRPDPDLDGPRGRESQDEGLPPFAPDDAVTARQVAREVPWLIVAALVVTYLFRAFVAQAFYIPSGSMLPQLQINDRVFVSRVSYRLHEPRRGDIVVFDAPPMPNATKDEPPSNPLEWVVTFVGTNVGLLQPSAEEYIKRVVALPGETVEGRGGHVYVDGRRLVEPYLPPEVMTGPFEPVRVPDGFVWVMGDNRGNSQDSRVFGPIRVDSIVGRAILRVWPVTDASFL